MKGYRMSELDTLVLNDVVEERMSSFSRWLDELKPTSKKEIDTLIALLLACHKIDGYNLIGGRYQIVSINGDWVVGEFGRASLYIEGDSFRLRVIEMLKCIRKDL